MSAAAFAADISGIWTGQVPARNNEIQDITFRFTANGAAVTGKLYGDYESLPVTEAKVEGEQITFVVTTEMNGGQSRWIYTGTVKGNEMQLTRKRELPPGDPAAARNNPQPLALKRLIP